MKTFKRFSAILIAVFLMVSMMVVPASAAGSYSITIKTDDANHQYEAYQIFEGVLTEVTVGGNTSYILTEIDWGDGVIVNPEGKTPLGDAEAQAAGLASPADAQAFAEGLVSGGYLNSEEAISATAGTGNYTISGLEPGYYLVKDKDGSIGSTSYHAYTDYILKVVKNVTVAPKAATPTLTKKASNSFESGYTESISAAIAHDAYFELNASLPSQIGTYDTYKMTFVDTLPAGLDYVEGSVKVYTNNDGSASTLHELATEDYEVTYSDSNKVLTVTVFDARESVLDFADTVLVSDNIIVRFAAKLNSNAVIGLGPDEYGNQNRAVLQYSNNPNNADSYGTTTEQTSEVFTYSLQLVKVDNDDNSKKLPGAQFRLYRYEGASTNDKRYVIATDNGNGTYTITGVTATESEGTVFTTDANGQFTVNGVNARTYRLTEVAPPAGYNKLDSDVGIQITAELNASTGKLDSFGASKADETSYSLAEANVDNETGACVATITVTNKSGATLPETGGIGTTIFYGIGGVLVIGALSLLIVRKRTTAK